MPRQIYSKKINEWELDIEYQYIPAEEATHDYPGTGSHIVLICQVSFMSYVLKKCMK